MSRIGRITPTIFTVSIINDMEKIVSFSMPVEEFQTLIIDCVKSCLKHNPPIQSHLQKQPGGANSAVIPKHFMTREEAAKLLDVSLHTLNKWTKEGKIKGYRIGSRVRYVATELEASLIEIAV